MATEEGRPVARLLAAIRKTKKWLPSSLVKQCVVYGAGEFLDTSLPASKEKEEEIFGEMLEHLTQEASRTCILIEFRNLDNSMFGYRFFRKNDFFPVNWLRVRNSLHSTQKAEDRFSPSRIRQIRKGLKNGAKVVEAHTVEEIKEFSRMLHKVYSSRIRRYFPANDFFPPHEQHAYQRKTGKNIHRKIQGKRLSAAPSASIPAKMLLSGFQEECERPMHCSHPAYWQYGKHLKMPMNGDSVTWSSWM